MTISVSLPKDLVCEIKEAAQRDHRSISGQIAFFCDRGIKDFSEAIEDKPELLKTYESKREKAQSSKGAAI